MGRCVVDNRLGDGKKWVMLPDGVSALVKIPDEVRKCVAFVYSKRLDGTMTARGTAFSVAVVDADEGHDGYAVTARHLVDKIRALPNGDGKLYLRINTKAGGSTTVETACDDWVVHANETEYVDVAVLPMEGEPPEPTDWMAIPLIDSAVASEQFVKERGIGPGHDLFFPGLFAQHLGKDRNIPIIRVGNIAAMPGEPIKTEAGDIQ